jgi:hypothetical protein
MTHRLRRAALLAVVGAVAAAVTACGSSHPAASGSADSDQAQVVALAQCMRSHGVPGFPDPDSAGGFHLTTQANGGRGSVDIASPQVQAAYGHCRHVLPGGGPNLAQLQQKIQQELARALPGLVRFAQCIRAHGVPGFPDPTGTGFSTSALRAAGVSPGSSRFQSALARCQHALPAGVHMTIHSGTSRSRS